MENWGEAMAPKEQEHMNLEGGRNNCEEETEQRKQLSNCKGGEQQGGRVERKRGGNTKTPTGGATVILEEGGRADTSSQPPIMETPNKSNYLWLKVKLKQRSTESYCRKHEGAQDQTAISADGGGHDRSRDDITIEDHQYHGGGDDGALVGQQDTLPPSLTITDRGRGIHPRRGGGAIEPCDCNAIFGRGGKTGGWQ